MSNAFSPEGFGLRADTKIRTAGKMVFRVFHTMHYLKSPKCFLISISRKLQCQSGILHCQKQLISEEKEGKLKVPRFFGETGGKHTRVELTGKYDLFFMDIKPCAWFIVRRRKIVELVVLHIGNFSPRWKIWGGKTKYGGLFLNFFHSTIFFSTYPHNLSLCTIFCTL